MTVIRILGGTHLLKSYADIMNDISPDELYKRLLAYGLFTEKLPPILSSEAFYNYCITLNTPFTDGWRQYIYHESMRNINVPRPLGIPNPMAYQKLCRCLADNWDKLQTHFSNQTSNQNYKISYSLSSLSDSLELLMFFIS